MHPPTADLRIRAIKPLIAPAVLEEDLPADDRRIELVRSSRRQIDDIVTGADDRLLVVVGPCSIHDPVASAEYASRLAEVAPRYAEDLLLVMRVYFEKPRTVIGWKGLINDPLLDGSYQINRGLRIAREAGVTTILNPAPAASLDDALLSLCDYLTPNESEAEALTGLPVTTVAEAEKAADALLARGVGAVVITLGGNGALYRDKARSVHVPVISAGPVVETTGAGDAFNGGFAVALSEGRDVVEAVRFGCATAGISVTRPGTAPSMPARAEIDALLARG